MNESEKKVVGQMIAIFCQKKHKTSGAKLCNNCAELRQYALARLEHCKFGNQKPTCRICPIHCYRPDMKEQIRQVMRFAGPKMLLVNPIATIKHFCNEYIRTKKYTQTVISKK